MLIVQKGTYLQTTSDVVEYCCRYYPLLRVLYQSVDHCRVWLLGDCVLQLHLVIEGGKIYYLFTLKIYVSLSYS